MKYFFIIISKTWNDALGVVVAVAVVVVSRAVGWFGGADRGGDEGDTDGAGPGSDSFSRRLDQTVVSSPVFGGSV